MAAQIYSLVPVGDGLSNRMLDYAGTVCYVAAASSRQSSGFATNPVWADGSAKPSGIVETYRKGVDDPDGQYLGYGYRIFGGTEVAHGDGGRGVREAMLDHEADH